MSRHVAAEESSYKRLQHNIQHEGCLVGLIDACMSDALSGATQQVTSLATISGLLGGFGASMLTGVQNSDELVNLFLIASIICNLTASISSSLILMALHTDCAQIPHCTEAQLTTKCSPLYFYSVTMFVIGTLSFISFVVSYAFYYLGTRMWVTTLSIVVVSGLVFLCVAISGLFINNRAVERSVQYDTV